MVTVIIRSNLVLLHPLLDLKAPAVFSLKEKKKNDIFWSDEI